MILSLLTWVTWGLAMTIQAALGVVSRDEDERIKGFAWRVGLYGCGGGPCTAQAVVKVRVGEQAGATGATSSRTTHTKLHHTHLGGCLGNIINLLRSVVGALQIYRGYTQHGDHIICYIME
jgi:hypothetical protein